MGNINFYQGLTSQLEEISAQSEEKQIEKIKDSIAEFFNMKNIHFLFGSGTSCNAIPNMNGLFNAVKTKIKTQNDEAQKKEFEAICQRLEMKNNLEEVLGILYSHKVYLRENKAKPNSYRICNQLINSIENLIFEKINVDFSTKGEKPILDVLTIYKDFYRKTALRNKDLSRINIFTTNNDLFNETALDSLNIHYINGFSGGLRKFFNPALFNYTFSKRMDTSIEKFEPVENMVYLYKLHGSVNWIEDKENINTFFKIKEVIDPSKLPKDKNILIYPTPTKQNKSLGSPYVELFREFQKKLLEPHSVLFVIGYSFSDEHVNNVIYQALAVNSTINVVIINDIPNAEISKIDDNRIYRIWGEIEMKKMSEEENQEKEKSQIEKIHYFNYIVKNLLPNIDAFKHKDNSVEKFINFYNENLLK